MHVDVSVEPVYEVSDQDRRSAEFICGCEAVAAGGVCANGGQTRESEFGAFRQARRRQRKHKRTGTHSRLLLATSRGGLQRLQPKKNAAQDSVSGISFATNYIRSDFFVSSSTTKCS